MSTVSTDNFKTDPNNYLGSEYNNHLAAMYALALSSPKEFYSARANASNALKTKIIKEFYDTIYLALSEAKTSAGLIYGGAISGGRLEERFGCKYPKQKINEKALSFVSTLNDMMDEIIEIIMPNSINRVVDDKLAKVGDKTLP